MLKKLTQKLKNSKGFTVGEVLVCVLILLLASGLLVGGVVLASNHFERSFRNSHAQVLSSTLMAAIEGELRYTSEVTVSGTGEECTLSSYVRPNSSDDVSFTQTDGRIQLLGTAEGSAALELVAPGTYSHGLRAEITSVSVSCKDVGGRNEAVKMGVTMEITKANGEQVEEVFFDVIPIAHPRLVSGS